MQKKFRKLYKNIEYFKKKIKEKKSLKKTQTKKI